MKHTAETTAPKRIFTYEILEKRFVEGVMKTVDVDYGSPASVRRNNRGVDAYRKAAAEIGVLYPHRMADFAALLTHEHPKIRLCTAICLVELMPSPPDIREQALALIGKHYRTADGADKMIMDRWMKNFADPPKEPK
ncbi:MAG: hypothetical protein J6K29_05550 [Clostridia bacterium]|nr:hypothetical protein [Clostridia bacterium]